MGLRAHVEVRPELGEGLSQREKKVGVGTDKVWMEGPGKLGEFIPSGFFFFGPGNRPSAERTILGES